MDAECSGRLCWRRLAGDTTSNSNMKNPINHDHNINRVIWDREMAKGL